MKNIKEKALELFPEMQTDSSDWDVIEAQCDRDEQRKAFVLGANYVLEQIEEILALKNQYTDKCVFCDDLEWRIEPQTAWGEEDEQYLLVCKNALAKYQTTDKWDACIISHWLENKLKSIKERTTWKPSKEQIKAFEAMLAVSPATTSTLIELYQHLNKLREE